MYRRNQKRVALLFLMLTFLVAVAALLTPKVRPVNGPQDIHQQAIASRFAVIKKRHPNRQPMTIDSTDSYWAQALQEVDKSPEEIDAQAKHEERLGIYLPKLIRGNPREKLLALTFDDGPHPGFTEKLLALLKQMDVKATFFVVGKMVERNPQLLKEIAADGHLVGNHTFSHVTLTKIPMNEVRAEYEACNDIVEDTIGQRMRFCRPPGGDYDRGVVRAATEQGLTTVLWTDDPGDYASPGTHVIERKTLLRMSNGGIILLHDGIQQTLDVLPQIIAYARQQGYKFVTVDELLSSLYPPVRYGSKSVAVNMPDKPNKDNVVLPAHAAAHANTPTKSTADFVHKPAA